FVYASSGHHQRHSFPTRRSSDLNYKVISVVSSGEAAIEKAKTEKPDLVLMDITLKGKMDGIEAASVITSLGIPVIYLSALTDKEDRKSTRLNSSHVKISYAVFCL